VIMIANEASPARFIEINKNFGGSLKSDILLIFPHLFSSGIPEETFDLISPEAVFICAGREENIKLEAMSVFEKTFWFSTSSGNS
ncbi:MAG: hypothetical protein N2445_03760, partial [Acidobacteria bacterium]|nr:hypothetical protein [Acidobacteriota bacterium]